MLLPIAPASGAGQYEGGAVMGRCDVRLLLNWKVLVVMLVLAFVAACSSDVELEPTVTAGTPEPTMTSVPPEPTSTPSIELPQGPVAVDWIDVTELEYPESSSLLNVLSYIPDDELTLEYLAINDIAGITRNLGLTRPGRSEDADAGLAYAMQLVTGGISAPLTTSPFSGELPALADRYEWLEESQLPYWGFDWRNYGTTALVRWRGDEPDAGLAEFGAIVGEFDFEHVAASIADCDECRQPERGEMIGQPYLMWDVGTTEDRNRPPFFGNGFIDENYVTVQDDALFMAKTGEFLRQALEASTDDAPALSDSAGLVSMVRAVEAMGANGTVVSYASFAVDDLFLMTSEDIRAKELDAAASADLLLPFTAVASGAGIDVAADEQFTALVLLHDDSSTAEANVTRLLDRVQNGLFRNGETGWADWIARVEIGVDGNLLVARLYHSGAMNLMSHIPVQPNTSPVLTISE